MDISVPALLLIICSLACGQKDPKPLFTSPPGGGKGLISGPDQKQPFLNRLGPSIGSSIDARGGLKGRLNDGLNGRLDGGFNGRMNGGLAGPDFNDHGFNGGIAGNLMPMERITKHTRTTEHHFHDDHGHGKGHVKDDIGSARIAGPNMLPPLPRPRPRPLPRPYPRPTPRHRPMPLPLPQRIPIPVPYPVPRPIPVPITRTQTRTQPIPVPYPVRIPYPVTVPQPVPVRIPQPVHVHVPRPYPVHIPQPYPVPVNTGHTKSTVSHGCGHGQTLVGGRCISEGYEHYERGGYSTGYRRRDETSGYGIRGRYSGYGMQDYLMAGLLEDSFDMGFRDNDFNDMAMLYMLRRGANSQYGRYRSSYHNMMGRGRRGGFGRGYGQNDGYGGYGYGSYGYGGYGYGGYGYGGGRSGGGSSGSGGEGGGEGGEGGSGGGSQGYYWQNNDNDD